MLVETLGTESGLVEGAGRRIRGGVKWIVQGGVGSGPRWGWLSERVGDFPGGLGGKGKSVKRWGPGEAERKERIWRMAW